MANQKINDIAAAGSVLDTMQFETDIGGTTPNKVTALQIKNYVGGAEDLWTLNVNDIEPKTDGNDLNMLSGGFKDTNVTTAILLGDVSNTSFNTTNQTIIGAVNETLSSVPNAVEDNFTATLNQTIFTLSSTPASADSFTMYLNGQLRLRGTDYTQSGTTLTWLNPGGLNLVAGDQVIARYNDTGAAGAPVASVFGRTGAVVAAASDYDASQVDNDSGVTGSTVADALNTLDAAIPTVPVDSVFGRTGAVVAAASDYDASQVDNDSTVTGATVKDALETLASGGGTKEVFYAAADYNANLYEMRTRSLGSTAAFNFTFMVPSDFDTLVSLEMILIPVSGAGGPSKDIDLTSNYGVLTEDVNTFTESDTTTLYNLGVDDESINIDISAVFSSLAANQVCGINWDNNGLGGTSHHIGIRLIYTI